MKKQAAARITTQRFLFRLLVPLCMAVIGIQCTGCIIPVPILVFTAPSIVNDKSIEFIDARANGINRDGWVLICHKANIRWCEPTYHEHAIVPVRAGSFQFPSKWLLASISLEPNYSMCFFAYGSLFQFPPGIYNLLGVFAVPLAAIPLPTIQPIEGIRVFPLIPGYCPVSSIDSHFIPDRRGRDTMILGNRNPALVRRYWLNMKRLVKIAGSDGASRGHTGIHLEYRDYVLLNKILDAGIASLGRVQPQSDPFFEITPQFGSEIRH